MRNIIHIKIRVQKPQLNLRILQRSLNRSQWLTITLANTLLHPNLNILVQRTRKTPSQSRILQSSAIVPKLLTSKRELVITRLQTQWNLLPSIGRLVLRPTLVHPVYADLKLKEFYRCVTWIPK